MRLPRTALIVAATVLVAAGLWLRHYFSPGEVVKRKVRAVVEAFEEERLLGAMALVSRSYSDQWGNSYESAAGYLRQLMDACDDFDVESVFGGVDAAPDTVRVGLEFVVSGRCEQTSGLVFGSPLEPCAAVLVWQKETPGWRLATIAELDIPELREELEARRPR